MSNWFELNATKSVIAYTLVIAAATWATSTFVLQDNRISLLRSEVDSQKTLVKQYKSKVDLLQRDLDVLRAENSEYRMWLGQTKDAIPSIVPRLSELKAKVATLEADNATMRTSNPNASASAKEESATRGRAFIDPGTGIILTVKGTTTDRTAEIILKLPESLNTIEQTVNPGAQWKFAVDKKLYMLTITEISFVGDVVRFTITEARK